MNSFMKEFIDLIQDPFKSMIATLSGTLIGYTPKLQTIILDTQITSFDRGFQHAVWFVTIVVAILAIISGVQKQVDRYRKNHKKHNNLFNIKEEEDD